MKILAYLNISNVDDIESDSGYIFNYILEKALNDDKHVYYIILPKKIEGKRIEFDLGKCFFVDMGVTKYESRYHFEWTSIENIIKNVKPDIVINNQVELTASFRVLLNSIGYSTKLYTYCHYPALHVNDAGIPILDSSLNLGGLCNDIVCDILNAVNIADAFFIQSVFAKNLIVQFSQLHNFQIKNEIYIVSPPYDDRLFIDTKVEKKSKYVLYNHRLYDSYGTKTFIDFVEMNQDIQFLVADPMANRGEERRKHNDSPSLNRKRLEKMENVRIKDGGNRLEYIDLIDDSICAVAPYREACVWSMSIIDCYCRWVPVVAPDIAAFREFVPEQLLFFNLKQEKVLIRKLIDDKEFWLDSVLKCRKQLEFLSPQFIASQILGTTN